VKRNHFWWLIPIIALALLLILPLSALDDVNAQTAEETPTPTPIKLYPDDVVTPRTHFPGLIAGAIVIVLVIMVGVLVRPRK
jgi:hypothetical protein